MATGRSEPLPGCRRRRRYRQREPQPQRSPSSPDPSPSPTGGGGETAGRRPLPAGAEVEVRLDGKGYYGAWFEATVVGFAAAPARYSVTFDGDGDIARFAPTHVRPRPPEPSPSPSPPHFCPHDAVEALHERGWWPGLVLSVADAASISIVTVAFPITREVVTYMAHLVRPRRDYVDGGGWVPSRAVVAASSAAAAARPKRGIKRYEVGEAVEIVREREVYGHSWFPAVVAKIIDEFSYIVEYDYSHQNWEDCEYLHWQFIRPAMRQLRPHQEKEFQLGLGPGAAVEVCCDGAWSAGVLVHGIREDDGEYVARINGRQGKQLITKKAVQFVRPLYKWDGMDWSIVRTKRQSNFKEALKSGKRPKSHVEVPFNGDEHIHDACAKRSMITHPKLVLSDNVQNQLERKKPLLRKVYSSKKRLIKEKEIAGSQRQPLLALERSKSTQLQLDCTLEDTMNGDKVKYHEPIAVVPLSIESASDYVGINGSTFDEGRIAQDDRITDVLAFVRSTVEEMDVFKWFPQQPHFLPLQQKYTHTLQKNMALGLKIGFDDCVRCISKSSIADNERSFADKKSALAELKSNGFDVEYFECLLHLLIKQKDEYSKHLEEKLAVEAQKELTKSSLSQNDVLLLEIDNGIAKLEKELGLLRQKGQLIEKEKQQAEEKLSGLDVAESRIEEALNVDTLQFNGILSKLKQIGLA